MTSKVFCHKKQPPNKSPKGGNEVTINKSQTGAHDLKAYIPRGGSNSRTPYGKKTYVNLLNISHNLK